VLKYGSNYSKAQVKKALKPKKLGKLKNSVKVIIFIRLVSATLLVTLACSVALVYGVWVYIYDDTLKYDLEHHTLTGQSSIVLDTNGNEIYRFLATQNREFISIDRLPDYVWQAFVVSEDVRMLERGPKADNILNKIGWGWDLKATLRATYQTYIKGNSQGGSTIAQQVLRATVTGVESGKNTVLTKAQEIVLADRFMRELYVAFEGDLDAVNMHILETYINSINFGSNMYSIATASQFYFNKPAYELGISEAAVLSALLPAPYRLNPVSNPKENRVRQERIIESLYSEGFITEVERDEALADPVHERVGTFRTEFKAEEVRPWFIDALFNRLRDDLVRLGHVATPSAAGNVIHNAGLIIKTTLDPDIQSIVDEVFLDESYWKGTQEYLVQYRLSYLDNNGEDKNISHTNKVLKTKDDIYSWRDEIIKEYVGEEDITLIEEVEYQHLIGDRRYLKGKTGTQESIVGKSEEIEVHKDSEELWRFPKVESLMDETWSSSKVFDAVIEHYGDDFEVITKPVYETRYNIEETYLTPDDRVLEEYLSYAINPQAATVLLENGTARVLALSGGRGEKETNLAFNRAIDSRRSPGSVAKSSVYALAMEMGIFNPDSIVVDKAWQTTHAGKVWRPMNYDNRYGGSMSVRRAYASSVNTIPARYTFEEIGYETLFEFQKRAGFNLTESDNVPAISIGGYTQGVTQLEQAGFFQALANKGKWLEPILYDSVYLKNPKDEFDSTLWFNAPQEERQIISPITAFKMSELSREVVLNGTGAGAKDFKHGWIGGKTGTSQEHTDLLWAHYTQHFTMSTWFGYDLQRNSAGKPNSLLGRTQSQVDNSVLIQGRIYDMLGITSEPPEEPEEPEETVLWPEFKWNNKNYPMGTANVRELMPKRNIDNLTGKVIPPRPYEIVQRGSIQLQQVGTEFGFDLEGNFGEQPVYGEVFVPEMEQIKKTFQDKDVEVWDEELQVYLTVTPEAEVFYEYRPIFDREYYGEFKAGEWVGEPKSVEERTEPITEDKSEQLSNIELLE
jgi:membrane peptidoglycan carboxypeptidase